MGRENPVCKYAHRDCFALRPDGSKRCRILSGTNFGSRDCPFYKSLREYSAGISKYGRIEDEEDD